ncbi:MAG: CrcB family protein, partial [Armatimonadota bacterium]
VVLFTQRAFGEQFPYGTLAVNILGGFLIGLLAGGQDLHPWVRTGLVIGVLGGFTTFSAFSWDTLSLASAAGTRHALFNILANVILAVMAAWGGISARSAIR